MIQRDIPDNIHRGDNMEVKEMELDMLEKVTGGAAAPDDKQAMEDFKSAWVALGLDGKYSSHVRNQVGDSWIKAGCAETAEEYINAWLANQT